MIFYYSTANYSVALNAKVGSSSMARAIIKQFYPEQNKLIRDASYPQGQSEHDRLWHWMCKGKYKPDKPVVLLVRDPVDRFISACQQIGIQQKDVDMAIDSLINDSSLVRGFSGDQNSLPPSFLTKRTRRETLLRFHGIKTPRPGKLQDDVHFFHQHKYAVGDTFCFKFPEHIEAAAKFIGLVEPLPQANQAKRQKVQLNNDQIKLVQNYYSIDQALFDSITEPGYIYNTNLLRKE